LEDIITARLASADSKGLIKDGTDSSVAKQFVFEHVTPKDLIKFGLIPEFAGRFSSIVSTKPLEVSDLVSILTEPEDSVVSEYTQLLEMRGAKLHITESALYEMAATSFEMETGARGLRSTLERVMMETLFVVPSTEGVHTVYVDGQAVRGERKPILLTDQNLSIEELEKYLIQHGDNFEVTFGARIVNADEIMQSSPLEMQTQNLEGEKKQRKTRKKGKNEMESAPSEAQTQNVKGEKKQRKTRKKGENEVP
jgi:C-terminal, D2-small domain, of ClpB protein